MIVKDEMSGWMPKPGPKDSLTDISGIKVGHAVDEGVKTGVTVVLPDRPCPMAVDVRGGGPGTRETEALDPSCVVSEFHALVLAGGSVFGLDAAGAVTNWLASQNRGLPLKPRAVPVVPSAILYDLANGGDKEWGETSPYAALGRLACESAGDDVPMGPVGAGFGATAGSKPGGIGTASLEGPDGLMVAALIVVNSFGEVFDGSPAVRIPLPKAPMVGLNTTIGLVATNAALDKAQQKRIAIMAQDGLARTIRPIHTVFDGDSIFSMATGEIDISPDPLVISLLGTLAADCVAKAVHRAVL